MHADISEDVNEVYEQNFNLIEKLIITLQIDYLLYFVVISSPADTVF